MTNLLGLPLQSALKRLADTQNDAIVVTRYTAPRDKNARGTLRVVKAEDSGRRLTVCLFNDEEAGEDTHETGTNHSQTVQKKDGADG